MSPPRDIAAFRNRHPGADVYVIGSGASMDYHDPEFFRGRLTIGINEVFRHFPCLWTVAKELTAAQLAESAAAGAVPVVSRHPYGNLTYPPAAYDIDALWYTFDHETNRHTSIDWSVLNTNRLIVSYSTVTSAIHFAAHMGAKNIFLAGTDAGILDGKINFKRYTPNAPTAEELAFYSRFLRDMRPQTLQVRDRLRDAYGCRILTLSPFVNLDHEGHKLTT